MRYFLHTFVSIGIVFFGVIRASAEIKIKFPSERAVFQRDKNNTATIYISGIYTKVIDRVEAKLSPIQGGETVEWTTIQSNVQGGAYNGSLQAKGGWYRLEIRGWRGDQLVDTRQLDRVGVGEVFLIAGQSNAQGYNNMGSTRANDDRVSCVSATPSSPDDDPNFSYPSFSHLESDSKIPPRGHSSWAWGKLGDILANRYGVPILFYNAGWYGSAARNWQQSLNGGYTESVYKAGERYEPQGSPYIMMKSVLQYYVPITGIRGVLWLQGEADNDINTGTDSYYNDIKALIEKSRTDSGKNLSWMLSLTSYSNRSGFDNAVIDGQKKVISSVSNVFTGPNTDQIQVPRIDDQGVHFLNEGLAQLGEAWGNQINDDFMARSEPHPGLRPLQISISCAGNNTVRLNVNGDGYNSFSWNNGQNTSNVQVGNGSYRVSARDNTGNTIVSPEIEIYETVQPPQPNISIQGSNPICRGNTSTLISSIQDGIKWNTGSEGDRITVSTAGDYSVNIKNVYGCESSAKVSVGVIDSPLPEKPTISTSGATIFCDGGEVRLTSSSKVKNVWSNGSGDATISVRSSGDFRVMALDDKGCYSPESDVASVKVNPLPAKPVILLSRSTTFCANEELIMTSSYDNGNTWSTSATSKSITVTTEGNFNLKQTDGNGCVSMSDGITTKVNPLPATPTVTALRPTTFCERDYTVLQGSEAYQYVWSNGSNGREVQIYESGNYTLSSRDANGCISVPSPALQVTRNPLPSRPVITADGPTTFCADLSVNLSSDDAPAYLWSNGATTKTVKINTAGSFTVQKISEFNCFSDPSNSIGTQTLALPPAPAVRALDVTAFCDGDFVDLVASNGDVFFWNNGVEDDTLRVPESGEYAARIRDNVGCFSPYSAKIVVEAKPNPAKPEIVKTGVYTLLAQNNIKAGKYIWQYGSTVLVDTTATIKANNPGSYVVSNSVVYSATLTCVSPFSEPFTLFVNNQDQFVAYPNPSTTGRVTLETMQNLFNVKIQVMDLRGVVHKNYSVPVFKFPYTVDLSDLPNALYLIRLNSSVLNETQKIILAR